MIEIEVLARDAVHVRDRHLLDARQVVVGRLEPVERERIRPHRGELGDGVALQLRSAALLELGRLDQLGRHTVACDARQNRAHLVLERLGSLPAVKETTA